jgi:hypothetical protein
MTETTGSEKERPDGGQEGSCDAPHGRLFGGENHRPLFYRPPGNEEKKSSSEVIRNSDNTPSRKDQLTDTPSLSPQQPISLLAATWPVWQTERAQTKLSGRNLNESNYHVIPFALCPLANFSWRTDLNE